MFIQILLTGSMIFWKSSTALAVRNFKRCLSMNNNGFEGYRPAETKAEAYRKAIEFTESKGKMPCIILVNPYLDSNVGSVARAMLNFGLTELRIVDPVCDIKSDNALALAVGAYEILDNAKIYSTLPECVADLNSVLATTIRPRGMTQLIYSPEIAADVMVTNMQSSSTGILFGRERSGLTNDEVALADGIIAIPSFKHFSSLNLAQAVNIVGYEIFKRFNREEEGAVKKKKTAPDVWLHGGNGERLARKEEVANLLGRLNVALAENNYQKEPVRQAQCLRSIGNILQRVMLTITEVDLMHGVLTCLIRPKFKNASTLKTAQDEETNS